MLLKAYGSRASMPFFSRESIRYGGNTSCYRLDMNGRTVIFDCGTGIMQYHAEMLKENAKSADGGKGLSFDILLSHLHLDHIIGLSMFDFLYDKTNDIRIYTRSRTGFTLDEQVFGIFKPPYWPVKIEKMNRAKLIEITGAEVFNLTDEIKVTTFDSMHENDTTAFRVEGEKTVVYLLDYEVFEGSDNLNALAAFCENTDVVILDATYLPEDYIPRKNWGHSTYEAGLLLAEKSRCKRMVLSHHFHIYTDEILDTVEKRVKSAAGGIDCEFFTAFDGMLLKI